MVQLASNPRAGNALLGTITLFTNGIFITVFHFQSIKICTYRSFFKYITQHLLFLSLVNIFALCKGYEGNKAKMNSCIQSLAAEMTVTYTKILELYSIRNIQ